MSLISWLLGVLLLLVGSTWVTFLALQAQQEGLLELHSKDKTLTTIDYDLLKYDNAIKFRPHRNANSLNNSILSLTNGRLPKGLDPAATNENNTEQSTNSNETNSQSPTRNEYSVAQQKNKQITLDILPSQNKPDSLQMLRDRLAKLNQQQRIYNMDKFPPLAPDGIVFIVQAHRRQGYLEQLFNSMRTVDGIEKILLVISHDYYYDEMMDLVKTVEFCKVRGKPYMYIYYEWELSHDE